jgi:tight adherence protein C
VDALDHGDAPMSRSLPLLPALLVSCAVLAVALRVGVRPARVTELSTRPPTRPPPAGAGLLARIGGPLRHRLDGGRDAGADRMVGLAIVVGAGLFVVAPPLALGLVVAVAASSVVRRRRVRLREAAALVDELPEVVDLLWLATAAGLTVPLAVRVVERHGTGRLAGELGRAGRRAELGTGLADALDEIPGRLGEPVRPLARALAGALRDGTSITESLERVAGEVRTARRRAAEERARRASVRLLFPLVLCVLPAFALLTVVPLLAGALRGLSL